MASSQAAYVSRSPVAITALSNSRAVARTKASTALAEDIRASARRAPARCAIGRVRSSATTSLSLRSRLIELVELSEKGTELFAQPLQFLLKAGLSGSVGGGQDFGSALDVRVSSAPMTRIESRFLAHASLLRHSSPNPQTPGLLSRRGLLKRWLWLTRRDAGNACRPRASRLGRR